MDFANHAEEEILNAIFRGTTFPVLANMYISLHTADPGETGASEVTAGDYARITVASTVGNWSDPSAGTQGETDNLNDILFAVATSNWGTITHMGIWDAISAGNIWFKGALTASKVVNNGDQFKFSAGDLNIQLD